MSIDPIRYKPWSGERANHFQRIFVISKFFFLQKIKSKWILLLLILGIFISTVFPIFMYSMMPHEGLDKEIMADHMQTQIIFIFTLLLVAMICSDTISEDLRSNSFVLYFSRAIKTESYLAGKIGGAFLTLSTFTLVPPILLAIIITATQSGNDYLASFGVVGITVVAAIANTLFFLPFGLLISSLTNRKSYAAVGTFMITFILMIISGIFMEFNSNWELIDPYSVLYYFQEVIYGFDLPSNVNSGALAAIFTGFMTIPLALVYIRIHLKAVGK